MLRVVERSSRNAYLRARRAYRQTAPVRLHNDVYDLTFRANSPSDRYVYREIFGPEDTYRRDVLTPIMRGATVVEIGAHKGFFTALAGTLAARVIALEPDTENCAYLRRNVRLNDHGNVTVVQQAVSDRAGTKMFTVSGRTAARHTFFGSQFSGAGKNVEVQCTTLPALLRDHGVGRVGLLKLDCEGSEYDVLLGCDAETLDHVDAIVMEIHESDAIPHRQDELVGLLGRHGFIADVYDERVMENMHLWMALFTRPVRT